MKIQFNSKLVIGVLTLNCGISLGAEWTSGADFWIPKAEADESQKVELLSTPVPILRWTHQEDSDGSLSHILSQINTKLGTSLQEKDFLLQEERDLAYQHYQRWIQLMNQIPIRGRSIRVWTDRTTHELVQVEANVNPPALSHSPSSAPFTSASVASAVSHFTSKETLDLVRPLVAKDPDDPNFQGFEWKDEWQKGQLVRQVRVKGKRGIHHFSILISPGLISPGHITPGQGQPRKILSHQFREFPQDDLSIPVQVYPIYEEVSLDEAQGPTRLPRITAELKHILPQIPKATGDIYAPLKAHPYYDNKLDPDLGETEKGRSEGYWSMNYIKNQAAQIRSQLPQISNDWKQGVLLDGRYASINIHPDALKQFKPNRFAALPSPALFFDWQTALLDEQPVHTLVPETAYTNQPIHSLEEAWSRPAQRLVNHDPTQYLDDGFDEIQVYYAIDRLFEVLHARGWIDPELSTRPFNAFLFNPDIAYRDNAFYTDDTINFTTYSSKNINSARDNSTIWHELGHGIMDRLMGDHIELADTGGLSEGMADFIAALVIEAQTQSPEFQSQTHSSEFPGSHHFRIINRTGFFLTNEVHDDGEAYGGAMKDFMDAVLQAKGPDTGLHQVTDVILEAMRLCRDYPGLTAQDWFQHVLFADSLGRPGLRQPGELGPYLIQALEGRNFRLDGGPAASFTVTRLDPASSAGEEIKPGNPGARETPIRLTLGPTQTADFRLGVQFKSSKEFPFHYPLQIRVQYEGGPLQGAIHWISEGSDGTQSKAPQTYVLQQESDSLTLPLKVKGACDEINRTDGSCVDYAYILVFDGHKKPVAKKRFYLRISNT